MDTLLSFGGAVGALVGLGLAAVIHWLVPGLEEQLTVVYAGLVAGGFFVGLILHDHSTFIKR
jgi:hypothetical protein